MVPQNSIALPLDDLTIQTGLYRTTLMLSPIYSAWEFRGMTLFWSFLAAGTYACFQLLARWSHILHWRVPVCLIWNFLIKFNCCSAILQAPTITTLGFFKKIKMLSLFWKQLMSSQSSLPCLWGKTNIEILRFSFTHHHKCWMWSKEYIMWDQWIQLNKSIHLQKW